MLQFILVVTNPEGRRFNIQMLWYGERYGAGRRLVYGVNDEPDAGWATDTIQERKRTEPQVEFYDATYQGDPRFEAEGQFVTRYYSSSLLEHRPGVGLILDGGVPVWKVSGRNMDEIRAWITAQIGGQDGIRV